MKASQVFRTWYILIALAAAAPSASAMLRAFFGVTPASWAATQIVVVRTTAVDGDLEVVEVWKGDLAVGSMLAIPELVPPANSIPLTKYPRLLQPSDLSFVQERIPRQPVGSRIVLFLKRGTDVPANEGGKPKREWSGWAQGTGEDEMRLSAVWIDGGETYSFQELWSTGSPLVLIGLQKTLPPQRRLEAYTVDELKRDVDEVLRLQREMNVSIAETSGRERALRLRFYATSKMVPARRFALEELGKCGPDAVGTISGMLDDPAFVDVSRQLVAAMLQAAPEAAGAVLNPLLDGELAFWKATAPSLSNGWWRRNYEPGGGLSPVQAHYSRTFDLLYGFEELKYKPALHTAIEMRNLWRKIPPIDESGNKSQIVDGCDRLIRVLRNK